MSMNSLVKSTLQGYSKNTYVFITTMKYYIVVTKKLNSIFQKYLSERGF